MSTTKTMPENFNQALNQLLKSINQLDFKTIDEVNFKSICGKTDPEEAKTKIKQFIDDHMEPGVKFDNKEWLKFTKLIDWTNIHAVYQNSDPPMSKLLAMGPTKLKKYMKKKDELILKLTKAVYEGTDIYVTAFGTGRYIIDAMKKIILKSDGDADAKPIDTGNFLYLLILCLQGFLELTTGCIGYVDGPFFGAMVCMRKEQCVSYLTEHIHRYNFKAVIPLIEYAYKNFSDGVGPSELKMYIGKIFNALANALAKDTLGKGGSFLLAEDFEKWAGNDGNFASNILTNDQKAALISLLEEHCVSANKFEVGKFSKFSNMNERTRGIIFGTKNAKAYVDYKVEAKKMRIKARCNECEDKDKKEEIAIGNELIKWFGLK